MQQIIVVDVETTGLSFQRGGRVIEVGAVAMENGIITSEFDTLIDTGTVSTALCCRKFEYERTSFA